MVQSTRRSIPVNPDEIVRRLGFWHRKQTLTSGLVKAAQRLCPQPLVNFTLSTGGNRVGFGHLSSRVCSPICCRIVIGAFLVRPGSTSTKNGRPGCGASAGGRATARYVVQNYPRSGTVYPINEVKNRNWHWQRFDLDYWARRPRSTWKSRRQKTRRCKPAIPIGHGLAFAMS